MLHFSRFLAVGLLSVFFAACSTASTAPQLYTNPTAGFSIQLPGNWTLPSATDAVPQFSSPDCRDHPSSCSTFTVQDDSKKFGIGPDATFDQLQNAGLQPIIIDSMIPGATVIAANPGIPSQTFFFAYHVFFPDAHKRFLIQSSDSTLERTVLSTLSVGK